MTVATSPACGSSHSAGRDCVTAKSVLTVAHGRFRAQNRPNIVSNFRVVWIDPAERVTVEAN